MEEQTKVFDTLKEKTEEAIGVILDKGIQLENVDMLYKLVDIHKDAANEDYWQSKKEAIKMRYRAYGRDSYGEYGEYGNQGSYGRRRRDSKGRYMERGVDAKYRGEDVLGEMYQNYQGYSEGKEMFGRGNYGAKEDTMQSLEYMLECIVDFVEMLMEDASSQEEVKMIKKYTKKISEM